jgi:hypothetical protein
MTRLTAAGQVHLEYRFSSTQNNGRITQRKDWRVPSGRGEEVNYTCDSLQRLIAASTTAPEWGLSFGYDANGNLTGGTYRLRTSGGFWLAQVSTSVYFAGKLLRADGNGVVLDRLGSVVYDQTAGRRKLFPYGEEATPATPNNATTTACKAAS